MRTIPVLLLIAGLGSVAACSDEDVVDIANNDSAALVEAIHLANARPGHDTIRLARNGLYILGTPSQPGLLLPLIEGDLTLEGNYGEIRGYSDEPAAILEVAQGAEVRVANLVMAEGTDGAIRNYGGLVLDHVSVVDSSVAKMPAIVLNHGRLEVVDSQIAYNLLLANRRDSGTVLNYGEMELERSRIHDNRAVGRQPSVAAAGGILNFGHVKADGLVLQDNEMESDDTPKLSFGGILNLGNGEVTGMTPGNAVRDARHAAVFTGF